MSNGYMNREFIKLSTLSCMLIGSVIGLQIAHFEIILAVSRVQVRFRY